MLGRATAQLAGSGFSVVLNQETQPGPEQTDVLWYQPSTGRVYSFEGGAWVTPHPSPANGGERRWWAGTLVDLQSFDGGDGSVTPPAANVGAMWVEDTDMQGRSPMHPGAIPTSNPAKTLAINENYGAGTHAQTGQEVGPHIHPLSVSDLSQTPGSGSQSGLLYQQPGSGSGNVASPPTIAVTANTYTTSQVELSLVHPVRGLYAIKRSARVNYVGS